MSVFTDEVRAKLNEPVDPKFIKQRPGPKGTTLDYVKGAYVANGLNSLFGIDQWTFEVKDTRRVDSIDAEGTITQSWAVLGRLVIGDNELIREDWGEDYDIKAATTDALKRCCHTIGRKLGGSLYE